MPFDCQSASWHDENVTPKSWLLVARGVATGCAADTGGVPAHQLVGTLHRSAGADHLDDEKCRAETLDIIFLRWDVTKRQKLSCDGVVGPSFASMK
ncbi:MAG: hypothetical protein E7G49_04365 [Cutibacterium granulosum]|nr:hypothetical protein [Cutibacterium granulosum]